MTNGPLRYIHRPDETLIFHHHDGKSLMISAVDGIATPIGYCHQFQLRSGVAPNNMPTTVIYRTLPQGDAGLEKTIKSIMNGKLKQIAQPLTAEYLAGEWKRVARRYD